MDRSYKWIDHINESVLLWQGVNYLRQTWVRLPFGIPYTPGMSPMMPLGIAPPCVLCSELNLEGTNRDLIRINRDLIGN